MALFAIKEFPLIVDLSALQKLDFLQKLVGFSLRISFH